MLVGLFGYWLVSNFYGRYIYQDPPPPTYTYGSGGNPDLDPVLDLDRFAPRGGVGVNPVNPLYWESLPYCWRYHDLRAAR